MINLSAKIAHGLGALRQQDEIENGVVISTDCLYPSNGVVRVSVRGAGDVYFVSDDGAALKEAVASGASGVKLDHKYKSIVEKQGLKLANGIISSPGVELESVPAAVVLVANASKELADSIFDRWRLPKVREFKDMLRALLKREFAEYPLRQDVFIGASNKPHKFDNVISLTTGQKLVVDPVLRDANSINSRVVANLDVHIANQNSVIQRIVYDDRSRWRPEDINLLAVSRITLVPYSKAQPALRRLKAA